MKLAFKRWYHFAAFASLTAKAKLSGKCLCDVTCPFAMVPKAGLEPARSRPRGILSPLRLPFRHFGSFWRHHPDSDWGIKVLQTSALPLGYGAITLYNMLRTRGTPHIMPCVRAGDGVPDCSGTCAALRYGPCGSNACAFRYYRSANPYRGDSLERETGFGPATFALARQRSTTEPLPHKIVSLVRPKRLELPHLGYQILSLARLPIPPRSRVFYYK